MDLVSQLQGTAPLGMIFLVKTCTPYLQIILGSSLSILWAMILTVKSCTQFIAVSTLHSRDSEK